MSVASMVSMVGVVAAYALTAVAADELTGVQQAICLGATTWYLWQSALAMVDEGEDEDERVDEEVAG